MINIYVKQKLPNWNHQNLVGKSQNLKREVKKERKRIWEGRKEKEWEEEKEEGGVGHDEIARHV